MERIDVLEVDQMACGRLDGLLVEEAQQLATRPGYYAPRRFAATGNDRPAWASTWYRVLPDQRLELYMANWDSSG